MSAWMDRLGGAASTACVTHCLAMAAAPALFPLLGLGFLSGELSEWGFTILATCFALLAAWLGFRSHRSLRIEAGFGVGIALLLAGRLGEELGGHGLGLALSLAGGGLLAVTHLISLWAQRQGEAWAAG